MHNVKTNFDKILNITKFLAICILFSGCSSTTQIVTIPPGAKLYINGEYYGETPYTYTDTKIVGSTNLVNIKKEGYKDFNNAFSRDEEVDIGALIGGVFVLIPFLWIMKYKPVRTYELEPEE
jgi:hypothetical protein